MSQRRQSCAGDLVVQLENTITAEQTNLTLAEMAQYLSNQWILRVDVQSMELAYPLTSAWKVTALGFRNLAGENGELIKADGPVTWVILQLNSVPVKQSITLINQTYWAQTNNKKILINIERMQSSSGA